jgi:long-subunit acyl-CoA synthetase (AMP-forming)
LEEVFIHSRFVSQIYIYGNTFRSYLIAVIVPSLQNVEQKAKELGIQTESVADLCNKEEVQQFILEDFRSIGEEQQLQTWEIPKALLIETTPFTSEK